MADEREYVHWPGGPCDASPARNADQSKLLELVTLLVNAGETLEGLATPRNSFLVEAPR